MNFEETQALDISDYGDDETDEEIPDEEKKPVGHLKVFCQKGFPETLFPLYQGDNLMGRQEGKCNIFLPLKALSKEHACIEVRGDSHFIYDKGSRNRTKRNKMTLSAHVRYELQHKDQILLADVRCEYLRAGQANKSESPIRKPVHGTSETGSETDSESMLPAKPDAMETVVYETSETSSDILQGATQAFLPAAKGGHKTKKHVTVAPATLMYATDSDTDSEEAVGKLFGSGKTTTVLETPMVSKAKSPLYVPESDGECESPQKTGLTETVLYEEEEEEDNFGQEDRRRLACEATQAYGMDQNLEEEDSGKAGSVGFDASTLAVNLETTGLRSGAAPETCELDAKNTPSPRGKKVGVAKAPKVQHNKAVPAEIDPKSTPAVKGSKVKTGRGSKARIADHSPATGTYEMDAESTRYVDEMRSRSGQGEGKAEDTDEETNDSFGDDAPTQTFKRPKTTLNLGGQTMAYEADSDNEDSDSEQLVIPGKLMQNEASKISDEPTQVLTCEDAPPKVEAVSVRAGGRGKGRGRGRGRSRGRHVELLLSSDEEATQVMDSDPARKKTGDGKKQVAGADKPTQLVGDVSADNATVAVGADNATVAVGADDATVAVGADDATVAVMADNIKESDATRVVGDSGANDATQVVGDSGANDATQVVGDAGANDATQVVGDAEPNDATQVIGDAGANDATQVIGDAGANDATQVTGGDGVTQAICEPETDTVPSSISAKRGRRVAARGCIRSRGKGRGQSRAKVTDATQALTMDTEEADRGSTDQGPLPEPERTGLPVDMPAWGHLDVSRNVKGSAVAAGDDEATQAYEDDFVRPPEPPAKSTTEDLPAPLPDADNLSTQAYSLTEDKETSDAPQKQEIVAAPLGGDEAETQAYEMEVDDVNSNSGGGHAAGADLDATQAYSSEETLSMETGTVEELEEASVIVKDKTATVCFKTHIKQESLICSNTSDEPVTADNEPTEDYGSSEDLDVPQLGLELSAEDPLTSLASASTTSAGKQTGKGKGRGKRSRPPTLLNTSQDNSSPPTKRGRPSRRQSVAAKGRATAEQPAAGAIRSHTARQVKTKTAAGEINAPIGEAMSTRGRKSSESKTRSGLATTRAGGVGSSRAKQTAEVADSEPASDTESGASARGRAAQVRRKSERKGKIKPTEEPEIEAGNRAGTARSSQRRTSGQTKAKVAGTVDREGRKSEHLEKQEESGTGHIKDLPAAAVSVEVGKRGKGRAKAALDAEQEIDGELPSRAVVSRRGRSQRSVQQEAQPSHSPSQSPVVRGQKVSEKPVGERAETAGRSDSGSTKKEASTPNRAIRGCPAVAGGGQALQGKPAARGRKGRQPAENRGTKRPAETDSEEETESGRWQDKHLRALREELKETRGKTTERTAKNKKTSEDIDASSPRSTAAKTVHTRGRGRPPSTKAESEESQSSVSQGQSGRRECKVLIPGPPGHKAQEPLLETGAAAETSSPILRHRTIERKPKVIFTGVVDEQGQKIVKSLRGQLVDSVQECTHLVTDQVRRTVKFLCGLAQGVLIVNPQWLEQCEMSKTFVDGQAFLVKDPQNEKKHKFSLQQSLRKAASGPMLAGYGVHTTASVKPTPLQMKEIIQCAGAEVLDVMPGRAAQQTLVISCPEDKNLCAPALRAGIPIVGAEFILTGILRQEVDIDAHQLFHQAGRPAAGRRKK